MPWGYAAGAALSVVQSRSASKSAERAAQTAASGADQATELQADIFRQNQDTLRPFIDGSANAFQLQQDLTGASGVDAQEQAFTDFRESPGVAFQRDQGLRGLEAGLGASGVGGGSRLKAISEFNQGLALQDFQNNFNRLGAVTGVGLNAAQSLAGVASSAGAGQAQTIQNAANERASGVLGRGAAFQSGLNNLGAIAGQFAGNQAPDIPQQDQQPTAFRSLI